MLSVYEVYLTSTRVAMMLAEATDSGEGSQVTSDTVVQCRVSLVLRQIILTHRHRQPQ